MSLWRFLGLRVRFTYRWQLVRPDQLGIVGISQLVCPRTHTTDVYAKILLVRGRRQGKRMVLVLALFGAGYAYPLTGLVDKIVRLLDLQIDHIWRKIQEF